MATVADVRDALSRVDDPELHRDLVSLGMVKDINVAAGKVTVTVELTTPACPLKAQIKADCEQAIRTLSGVSAVDVQITAKTRGSKSGAADNRDLLPKVKNVIIVASGKGGVGKSSVAVNIAATLAARGARTGLLDADIYGPSIPTMMGVMQPPEVLKRDGKERMVPVSAHGVLLMSIGFFVDPAQAVVWRGPMLHKALEQFIGDVEWGELDYLIVDLPPGTGDIHISISQFLRATGAVLVTTPQTVALADVIRGRSMFSTVEIPVLGLIENMSYFVCDGCQKEHEIFSRGGGARAADKLKLDFLGELPLLTGIREQCDVGVPVVLKDPHGKAALAFSAIVDRLVEQITRHALATPEAEPKLKLV